MIFLHILTIEDILTYHFIKVIDTHNLTFLHHSLHSDFKNATDRSNKNIIVMIRNSHYIIISNKINTKSKKVNTQIKVKTQG